MCAGPYSIRAETEQVIRASIISLCLGFYIPSILTRIEASRRTETSGYITRWSGVLRFVFHHFHSRCVISCAAQVVRNVSAVGEVHQLECVQAVEKPFGLT